MSYNIDNWTTKELRDFRIALEALAEEEDYIDAPEVNLKTGVLTFMGCAGGFEIRGKPEGGYLLVETITNYGSASGTLQEYLEEDVLPNSTGYLRAILVWEGGDSITRLIVNNGEVSNEEVEID